MDRVVVQVEQIPFRESRCFLGVDRYFLGESNVFSGWTNTSENKKSPMDIELLKGIIKLRKILKTGVRKTIIVKK